MQKEQEAQEIAKKAVKIVFFFRACGGAFDDDKPLHAHQSNQRERSNEPPNQKDRRKA